MHCVGRVAVRDLAGIASDFHLFQPNDGGSTRYDREMEHGPQASRAARGPPRSAGRDPAQGVAVARDRRRRAPDQPGDARKRRVRNSQIGEPVPFLGRDVATPRRGVTALRAATETCSKAQWCRASRRKPPLAGPYAPFSARRSMACSRCLTSPPLRHRREVPLRRATAHPTIDRRERPPPQVHRW